MPTTDNFGRKERTRSKRGCRDGEERVVSSVHRAKCGIATLMGTCTMFCVS